MNILIIGSGGRESALAHKISASPKCSTLWVAPGNAGTATSARNIDLPLDDFDALKKQVLQRAIDLIIVGPEKPLVDGLADQFKKDPDLADIVFIGPSKKGALLEGSKERAKEFMAMHQIPTAAYEAFTAESLEAGKQFLHTLTPPYVLKADGLAGGKGVLILDDLEEAKTALTQMLTDKKFGEAGETVVIEEFLEGIELSVFALTDGKTYKILPTAKDYKRVGEGDTGLNTGGMGALSPAVFADDDFMEKVEKRIVQPTIEGLQKEDIDYKGFLFFGLMKVGNNPYVVEYNVRLGDPETEVVLPRITSDLIPVFEKLFQGRLAETTLEIDARHTAAVMLVSGGYPEAYEKGKEITGLDQVKDSLVFQAGTRRENGKTLTNGGRVLAVTSYGKDYKSALAKAYAQVHKIKFDKMNYRTDLGKDLEK